MMKRFAAVAVLALWVSGCAVGFTPPVGSNAPDQYEVIVDRPFNDVWDDLVEYSSRAFFGIDDAERDSGSLTLSFGAESPGDFVDCGTVVIAGERVTTIEFFEMPVRVGPEDITELRARMNVFVDDLGPDRTLVRVNATYELAYDSDALNMRGSWAFSSGGSDTEALIFDDVTCQPTYLAERTVLESVAGSTLGAEQ